MRTKGIQLITASSITLSKGLTKQLIYEWHHFRCSHQHLKHDLHVWKANVLIVQKEQGTKTQKLLFKSATPWLLVMTGDVNDFNSWPSSKIAEISAQVKQKWKLCFIFWWCHHVSHELQILCFCSVYITPENNQIRNSPRMCLYTQHCSVAKCQSCHRW